ncbi:MAG: TIGR02391 family protein [Parabacteroides sp.]|jgi:uncharacterized protein (TIGR02391 family)|nr:TIGR02391 family protein [Parabacteroides sp.]
MAIITSFKPSTLEMLANNIADVDPQITGSVIHHFLQQAQIEDVSYSEQYLAKRKKLYNAFASYQNTYKYANNIIAFIQLLLAPQRYLGNEDMYNKVKEAINNQLVFEGLFLNEANELVAVEKASKITDVQIRVDGLRNKLIQQAAHQAIFHFCNEELLANNYFHAVFEANKGLFHRIQDLSGLTIDGNTLIEQAFSSNPILIINNYITQSEKDEHKGFCNVLKGLCGMFRNPGAHEPKIEWEIIEQDALEILGIISYCHRRLDKAQKIRLA